MASFPWGKEDSLRDPPGQSVIFYLLGVTEMGIHNLLRTSPCGGSNGWIFRWEFGRHNLDGKFRKIQIVTRTCMHIVDNLKEDPTSEPGGTRFMWRGCITRSLSYVDLPIFLSRWEQKDKPNEHNYQYNFFEMPESSTSQPHELDYTIYLLIQFKFHILLMILQIPIWDTSKRRKWLLIWHYLFRVEIGCLY